MTWVRLPFDRAAGLRRLLRLGFLGENRPAELAADALDEVVDQLFRRIGHFHGQEVDLGGEVVVEPHRRNREEQSARGGDHSRGVAPVVARMPRPRFNSAVMMSIWRSTARSAELMSAAVIVARSRSNGFTSASASPSTRATWLFLFFSASAMAPSSCSSCR